MDCTFNVGHHGNNELIRKNLQQNPDKINVEDFVHELCIRLENTSCDTEKEAQIFTEFRALLPEKKVMKFDHKVVDLTTSKFQHFYCTHVLATMKTKEERGEWVENMHLIFGKTDTFKELLRASTKIELLRSLSSETLFREDSLSNKLALTYCEKAIQKNVTSFLRFLRKQKKWPKGYIINNFHLKNRTVSSMAQNENQFQKLITSFAKNFLKNQRVNTTISEILKMRASSVSNSGYNKQEAERASASLYWLRFFGNEIMKRFETSQKDPDDPEWSVILTIQTLLTKVSSACPILAIEDILVNQNNKICAPHFDPEWSKLDYQKLMQKCYEILLPHFNNYMKRLSNTHFE